MPQRDMEETADDMEQNETIQLLPGTAVDTDGRPPSPFFLSAKVPHKQAFPTPLHVSTAYLTGTG